MSEPADFIDAGAGEDEPVKGITQGDVRGWHDELERLSDTLKAWDAQLFASGLEAKQREMWTNIERERCAQIAISFGTFPGSGLVKDLRMMCGNAIADKIRECPDPVGQTRGSS